MEFQFARKAGKRLTRLILAVMIGCLAFILLYPVLYMVTIAIRPSSELFNPASIWIPHKLTLIVLFIVLQKYFVESIERTGLVG